MKIKSITLENFRSYKEAIPIEGLSDVNIFIGPNNAGKSNILEALRYIQALRGGNQLRSFAEMMFDGKTRLNMHLTLRLSPSTEEREKLISDFFKDTRLFESAKQSAFLSDVTLDVVLGSNGLVKEEIKVSNIKDGDLTIIRNSVENKTYKEESFDVKSRYRQLAEPENISVGGFREHGRGSPGPGWRIFSVNFSPTPVEYKVLTKIREFIGKWHWFQPTRQATARMPPGEEKRLNSTGGNLVKFLNSILSESPSRYVALTDEVVKIVPNLTDVLSPLRGDEAVVNIREKGLEKPTNLANISFGVMQTLILAIGAMTYEPGFVLLVEEPELHLHAGSQRKLFKLIQKEAEQKQFFITTHSSIFTGCSDKVSTYLVTKRDGATNVRKIEEPSELKLVKNELGHRNTDLYGYECVVFLEGDSEQSAFPIIAEALEHDLIEKGIRLINIRGKGKVSKLAEYLKYLKDSDVLVYVIADGDKQVRERLDDWIRQGLLQKDCQTMWDLEFEDCFKLDMITKAMKEVAKEQGFKFEITSEDLKENMPKGKSVVKALEKLMYQKELPSLDKPTLSENLALLLKEEIEEGKSGRERTPPEQVIEKIVELVEARREET